MQTSYSMNQVLLNGALPQELETVCLNPTSSDYKSVDTEDRDKFRLLNNMARRLRRDKERPLVADVYENSVVILPSNEAEGRYMVEKGLDKRDLEPSNPPTKKISIQQSLYRRLLLRAFEISLRQKGYMVDEVMAAKYEHASTSFAYMYSSGTSATNKFFEVYRGAAFRILLYSNERKAGLVVDPKFRLLPRATFYDFAKPNNRHILKSWGGIERNGEMVFERGLEVMDVCPISPEDCKFRRSPFESECLLYNQVLDRAVSWPRQGAFLISIKNLPISKEPRIRQSLKNCAIISNHISDDTATAIVAFYKRESKYSYPLQRLRRPYTSELLPDFVTVLGGDDKDVDTMTEYFDRIVKLPPNERKFYTGLFVNDLAPFVLGERTLSFEKDLVRISVKPWKREPS